MDLFIKRKSDGEIFKVRKYVKAEMPDLEEHIWSNDWYGHHVIGSDCEWANGSTSEKDLRVCEVITALPSDVEIYEESKRVAENVKLFSFDPISFQYGARWIRGIVDGNWL